MNIPYIYSEVEGHPSLTVFLGGVPTPIDGTHPAFSEIFERINEITAQEVRELLDTSRQVRRQLAQFGNVTVNEGEVTYKGEPVNGVLADRMLQMLADGMDIRPWALFLENLKANPAKHAVDELYGWLEKANMPITERGNFLAYKKVADDFTSYHTNPDGSKFRNDIGTFVSMDRNKVCDDRTRTCSAGLHFCSWSYLSSYMGHQGKVVVLEINPAHVVSIPTDYNDAKGRAEGYLIIGEIPQEQCKHAFPGLAYVSYDSSPWITHRQEGDIDYSSIEDGWYSNYEAEDEIEEMLEKAYQLGYKEGYEHGYADEWFEPDLSEFDFQYTDEYDSYLDGYGDGFHEGDQDRSIEGNAMSDAVEELIDDWNNETMDKLNMTPQSTPGNWSVASVADDIDSGRLTIKQFVDSFYPSQWDVMDVIDELNS